MTAAIEIRDLGKRYHIAARRSAKYETLRDTLTALVRRRDRVNAGADTELWALKDVSLTIAPGETVGLIGSNGAGKSTLLKILSRITEPTTGEAVIHGRVGSLLEVGTGFHPELSGRENIFLNGAILGMRRRETEQALDEIVAFAEVERMLDTAVKHYSSGMYMRLAFAVAAHLKPEIMMVDEVLAVGDVAFQRKCLGKMGSVAREGRTVLFVSHNMQAIRTFCDRSIWLRDGQVVLDGPSSEVIDAYLKLGPSSQDLVGLESTIAALPPDPVFRLRQISLHQVDEQVLDVLSGRALEIRIEYDVYETTPGLHVTVGLCDNEGTLIFETLHNGDVDVPIVHRGRHISRAVIPPDFLAPTTYELRVTAGIASVRRIIPDLTLRLQVQASGRVNRAYPGYPPPGKLAPLIPWSTESSELPL